MTDARNVFTGGAIFKSKSSLNKMELGTLPPKKTGKCGNFEKTGGRGGLPESHFHFLLFFTWETPPKKVLKCKINHNFF